MKAILTLLFLLPSAIFSQNSDWVYRNPYPQNDFYAIKFFNQNTGYIVGSDGLLIKSITGGNSWLSVTAFTGSDLYSMYFFNVNTGYIVGDGGLILFTSNGGTNWTSVVTNNAVPLRSVTFTAQNSGFISGDNGELYKTTTGITGWQRINLNSNLNLNEVYFLNETKGFVCADSGKVFQTSNGGLNWSVQNAATNYQNIMCIEFTNTLTGYIGIYAEATGSNSNLYKTTDGGTSWLNVPLNIAARNLLDIKFINDSTGFISCDNGPVLTTTNSGTFWFPYGLPPSTKMNSISKLDTSVIICGTNGWISKNGPSGYQEIIGGSKKDFVAISFINENTGICIGDFQLNRTTNGGMNWKIQMTGNISWFEGAATYLINSRSFPSGSIYAISHAYTPAWLPHESISRSTDGGITWSYCYGSYGYYGGLDEKEGVTYISHSNSILKSTGGNYIAVYNLPNSSLGDVAFANALTGFVVCTNSSGGNGLLKTINGGVNWSFAVNPSNRSIENIEFLASGFGYASGVDSGYFMKTTDFGTTWQSFNTGLNQYNQDMKFLDENNGWLLNHFGGWPGSYRLYFTKNGALNFYPVTSLEQFNVKSFSFINANTGYVCGDSGKVLKTTNGGLTFITQNGELYPDRYILSQNYPNPFNPVTNIKFDIPIAGFVKITIFDLLGREVITLVNEQMQPGSYNVDWDASNYPSGVYFYKIEVRQARSSTGDFFESKKMVLMK